MKNFNTMPVGEKLTVLSLTAVLALGATACATRGSSPLEKFNFDYGSDAGVMTSGQDNCLALSAYDPDNTRAASGVLTTEGDTIVVRAGGVPDAPELRFTEIEGRRLQPADDATAEVLAAYGCDPDKPYE